MLDPRLLYSFDPELWESVRGTEPALVHLLDGYIDAGSITHGTGRYLLEVCEHEVLVEFDHDQLHDYRSRRPQMVFDTDHWVGMTDYALVIHKLTDAVQPLIQWATHTQWKSVSTVLSIASSWACQNTHGVKVPLAFAHRHLVLRRRVSYRDRMIVGCDSAYYRASLGKRSLWCFVPCFLSIN